MPSKLGRKLKRFDRRFGILKKLKKHGPRIGAAALALSAAAASAYLYSEKPSLGPSVGNLQREKDALALEDAEWARQEVLDFPPEPPMWEKAQQMMEEMD